MSYERKKDSGELHVVGVNIFMNPDTPEEGRSEDRVNLSRATPDEKWKQVDNLRAFQRKHQGAAPEALERLKRVARSDGNIFAELMEAVRVASLGQITHALYDVGGRYRRAM